MNIAPACVLYINERKACQYQTESSMWQHTGQVFDGCSDGISPTGPLPQEMSLNLARLATGCF